MKIRNTETGDILTLTEVRGDVVDNALRLEFASDEDFLVTYLYSTDTLEEMLEDDGYEISKED